MKSPAFRFYVDNFIEGTSDMTDSEVGLYMRLLCAQWSRGSLPNDDSELSRFSHGSTTVKQDVDRVRLKFELCSDGRLRNPRLELERCKQIAFYEAQSQKGKASAKARFNRGSTVVQPDTGVEPSVSGSVVLERESNFPEIPPIPRKQFDELVKIRGMTAEFGDWFWNANDARNWKDARNVQIVKVEPALLNAWKSWRGSEASKTDKSIGASKKPTGPRKYYGRWDIDHPPKREECVNDSAYDSHSQMWKLFFAEDLKKRAANGAHTP